MKNSTKIVVSFRLEPVKFRALKKIAQKRGIAPTALIRSITNNFIMKSK